MDAVIGCARSGPCHHQCHGRCLYRRCQPHGSRGTPTDTGVRLHDPVDVRRRGIVGSWYFRRVPAISETLLTRTERARGLSVAASRCRSNVGIAVPARPLHWRLRYAMPCPSRCRTVPFCRVPACSPPPVTAAMPICLRSVHLTAPVSARPANAGWFFRTTRNGPAWLADPG